MIAVIATIIAFIPLFAGFWYYLRQKYKPSTADEEATKSDANNSKKASSEDSVEEVDRKKCDNRDKEKVPKKKKMRAAGFTE